MLIELHWQTTTKAKAKKKNKTHTRVAQTP